MGNQNTSGIVDEKIGKTEAQDNVQGVIETPHSGTVENQTLVQENAAEGECDNIPHVERLACDDKADVEEDMGSVEGSDAVMDMSTNGSDLEKDEEEEEHPSSFTEGMQQQNLSPKCTTREAVNTTPDVQEEQNVLMKEALEADDHDAKKNDDGSASLEGTFSETRARNEERPQEEQSNSSITINEAPRISLVENEYKNVSFPLDQEEKPMIHGLGDADVDKDQPPDQEISTDSAVVINGEGLLEDTIEATEQSVIEKELHCESEPSATENENETTQKCVVKLQSSMEIETAETDTPRISKNSEPKASADVKNLDAEAQVELRKSPSFDFGISFDTRSEDSDQTPLLYQDKTARRSLSSCSNLRFQNTNVQNEYAVKPVQFEGVPPSLVEEKTILMERSNSIIPPSQVMNTLNNKQEKIVSNASPSSKDAAATSPKGNGRRKPKSSLFTTCICCTSAIS